MISSTSRSGSGASSVCIKLTNDSDDSGCKSNSEEPQETSCSGKHAIFDSKTATVTIPAIDVPLLDPFTGENSGDIAVFKGQLTQVKGIEDFVISPESFVFSEMASDYSECHAKYTYADGQFDKGGWLRMPFVQVPSIIIIPPNLHIPGPTKVFDVTLRQLAVDDSVLHLFNYTHLLTLPPTK